MRLQRYLLRVFLVREHFLSLVTFGGIEHPSYEESLTVGAVQPGEEQAPGKP